MPVSFAAAVGEATLITGCSSGIGRALAEEFHGRGHLVYATARKLESLEGLPTRTAALDVNDAASIEALVARLERDGASVSLLVNNAGYGAMGPLAELPVDELRLQLETNVVAVIAMIQALVPGMVARREGRIVNIGSVSGVLTTPFSGAYCASKAAVHALSDALRMELAPFGIHVVTVQPGAIQSEFGATAGAAAEKRRETLGIYAPLADSIAERAAASQEGPTPTEVFARKMADAVLAKKPSPVVRIGRRSTLMPTLKRWVPTRLLDRSLSKRLQLDRLR
jgi:short-subunit dehydrogenase